MTDKDINIVLTELKHIKRIQEENSEAISGINESLKVIAVQKEQIFDIRKDVDSLWQKYDASIGPDGTVQKCIDRHAQDCSVKANQPRLWLSIGGVTTIILGLIYFLHTV